MEIAKTKKFWDKLAGGFDKGEKQFEHIHSSILLKTKQYLKHGDNVLDFGCATGTKTIALANSVKKIMGIDISEKMIRIAKEKVVKQKNENIGFEQISIHDSSLENNSFDTVLAFNILHLLENNQETINRINQLLKKDGVFISATPCLSEKKSLRMGMYFFLGQFLSKIRVLPILLKSYSKSEIEYLLTSNGFEIINTEIFYDKLSNLYIVAKKGKIDSRNF